MPIISKEHAASDPNITVRKHKKEGINRDEILEMFDVLKKEQDSKFTALMCKIQAGIDTHTKQNNDISKSIDFLGQKYDEMVSRIDTLERQKSEDRKYIQLLETRIDQMDDTNVAPALRYVTYQNGQEKPKTIFYN